MKIQITIFILFFFISCVDKKPQKHNSTTYESEAQSPIDRGKELFDGAGNCFACHKEDQKIVAPSLVEIATIYKNQNADMVEFLKGNRKPIVDPSQYETMKTNFAITSNMTDAELKALETYVMSFAK